MNGVLRKGEEKEKSEEIRERGGLGQNGETRAWWAVWFYSEKAASLHARSIRGMQRNKAFVVVDQDPAHNWHPHCQFSDDA
jgi:hypothetical protein